MRLTRLAKYGSHVSIITDPIARYNVGQYSFRKSFMTLSANLYVTISPRRSYIRKYIYINLQIRQNKKEHDRIYYVSYVNGIDRLSVFHLKIYPMFCDNQNYFVTDVDKFLR